MLLRSVAGPPHLHPPLPTRAPPSAWCDLSSWAWGAEQSWFCPLGLVKATRRHRGWKEYPSSVQPAGSSARSVRGHAAGTAVWTARSAREGDSQPWNARAGSRGAIRTQRMGESALGPPRRALRDVRRGPALARQGQRRPCSAVPPRGASATGVFFVTMQRAYCTATRMPLRSIIRQAPADPHVLLSLPETRRQRNP